MNPIMKNESYLINGLCMEEHNQLGAGFEEIVYKDAHEYEFRKAGIPFEREKQFSVNYKGTILPHLFYADFVIYGQVIHEVKGVSALIDEHITQCINYLKVSGLILALLVNFGEMSLKSRRVVL